MFFDNDLRRTRRFEKSILSKGNFVFRGGIRSDARQTVEEDGHSALRTLEAGIGVKIVPCLVDLPLVSAWKRGDPTPAPLTVGHRFLEYEPRVRSGVRRA